MIATTCLYFSASLLAQVELERVVEGRVSEAAALVLPLAARQLDGKAAALSSVGKNFGDSARDAWLMNIGFSVGLSGTSVVFSFPWVMGTGPSYGATQIGNFGVGLRLKLFETRTVRVGVLGDLSVGISGRPSARALAFGSDLPRYAPNVHTLSAGGAVMWKSPVGIVAGLNAGGETHFHVDKARDDELNASLWAETWIGAPIELGASGDTRIWISPLVEGTAASTFSKDGTATDLALTTGVSMSFGSVRFDADYDKAQRFAVSAGYQFGVFKDGAGAADRNNASRVMLAVEIAAIWDRAMWSER